MLTLRFGHPEHLLAKLALVGSIAIRQSKSHFQTSVMVAIKTHYQKHLVQYEKTQHEMLQAAACKKKKMIRARKAE